MTSRLTAIGTSLKVHLEDPVTRLVANVKYRVLEGSGAPLGGERLVWGGVLAKPGHYATPFRTSTPWRKGRTRAAGSVSTNVGSWSSGTHLPWAPQLTAHRALLAVAHREQRCLALTSRRAPPVQCEGAATRSHGPAGSSGSAVLAVPVAHVGAEARPEVLFPALGGAVVEWHASTGELMVSLSSAPSACLVGLAPDPGVG